MAADCTTIRTNLDAALAAYQKLITGQAVVMVHDSDGSRIQYTPSNQGDLYKYIQVLQAQYDACNGGRTRAMISRPLTPFF